jgi:hypothetical protein
MRKWMMLEEDLPLVHLPCSTLLSVALLGFVAVFFFYDMRMKLVFFFPVNKRMLSTYCGIGIPGVLRQYD